ncbi:MAG: hypothetical protein IPL39_01140 [Opitutaceae bacterium]|nr:hypothetical protein [Opitutaceae bacterium]
MRRSGTRLPFLVLIPLALVGPLWAAEPVKDHALFMGATLHVGDTLASPELVGAEGTRVALLADGKVSFLPRDAVGVVRIAHELKLSSITAQIDNLETTAVKVAPTRDRFAGDRMQILMDSMIAQNEDVMDFATAREEAAVAGVAAAERSVSTPTFGLADAQRALEGAKAAYGKAAAANQQLRGSASSFTLGDLDKTAVEVVCDLSCPRETRDAYALLVTEYRINSLDKPQYKVHVEPLRGLGPKPQRVTMTQGGLPPGFVIGRLDLHVYANGQELASNLSAQRVDLTADQALQYLTLNYIASHPKETLPAVPQRIALPVGFEDRVPAALVAQSLYATVGPDGAVKSVAADTAGTAVSDAYVDAVVRKFRFNPALKEGKPRARARRISVDAARE